MKKILIGAGTAAVLALATACAGNGDTPSADTNPATTSAATQQSSHNDSDIMFAQQMIPHHEQAVDMAEAALRRATNPTVKDLAKRIKGAQDPEIQQLKGMLKKWGAAAGSDMEGMDHGSMSEPGMMSDQELARLEQAGGSEFDVMWTQLMIEHHQGAIEMAKAELREGSDAEAKALARRIVDAQEAEIREMTGLLPQ
ncbi:hypothetical protein SacmaDRAFT_2418 [Saccharomonospora marina XMU15]|uniref:DUF305 domain-containing protein n=1 Tax=Saccharomonospora marina XMU15 TaxID=882083 RepID=H5WYJ9_9PSEU|nr:DUF305 domain-containing protein [Saccharomonospora marina]EHR50664.1 hypothetical protein SacmaDRAFT_2418 [Saccharomonospora marina XMU15]